MEREREREGEKERGNGNQFWEQQPGIDNPLFFYAYLTSGFRADILICTFMDTVLPDWMWFLFATVLIRLYSSQCCTAVGKC